MLSILMKFCGIASETDLTLTDVQIRNRVLCSICKLISIWWLLKQFHSITLSFSEGGNSKTKKKSNKRHHKEKKKYPEKQTHSWCD